MARANASWIPLVPEANSAPPPLTLSLSPSFLSLSLSLSLSLPLPPTLPAMDAYLSLLRDVRENGVIRPDRTGTGTRSVFGRQLRFDLSEDGPGFPLLTTKKVHWKSVVHELLWFLRGETNVRSLQSEGVTIWDAWADAEGELGPVYGKQWRSWGEAGGGTVDQIAAVVHGLRESPFSRRHVVSAWNVDELREMALEPCHTLFQFYAAPRVGDPADAPPRLSCQLYQRSADLFLGVPFNTASYALLTMMIARVAGLGLGEFVHTFGDVHLYENHLGQADEQLARKPGPLPRVVLHGRPEDPAGFAFEDVELRRRFGHRWRCRNRSRTTRRSGPRRSPQRAPQVLRAEVAKPCGAMHRLRRSPPPGRCGPRTRSSPGGETSTPWA